MFFILPFKLKILESNVYFYFLFNTIYTDIINKQITSDNNWPDLKSLSASSKLVTCIGI